MFVFKTHVYSLSLFARSLLWVLWGATCAGLLLQELSSRLCVVSGLDLAQVSKQHYSKPTSYLLYAMMELAIIGSDIQEVLQYRHTLLNTHTHKCIEIYIYTNYFTSILKIYTSWTSFI